MMCFSTSLEKFFLFFGLIFFGIDLKLPGGRRFTNVVEVEVMPGVTKISYTKGSRGHLEPSES